MNSPQRVITEPSRDLRSTPTARVMCFDDGLSSIAPLADLRPSFSVRTGCLTTLERCCAAPNVDVRGVIVPSASIALTRESHAIPALEAGSGQIPAGCRPDELVLLLNGRCPIPPAEVWSMGANEAIFERIETSDAPDRDRLIAARVPASRASAVAAGDLSGLALRAVQGRHLISRPWHVRALRDPCILYDLALLVPGLGAPMTSAPLGVTLIGELGTPGRGLFVHPSVTIFPGTIFDVSKGAIVLADNAIIRPGAILIGPCFVGQNSTILERATLRENTAIGPYCKVNGEVGGTIFQGFSNKAHDGYVGDSWIGEWVNLGAGTTTSNLLNTYGEVIARHAPDGKHERTGEKFLGAIIGDHVKAAICTRIMTGSVLHTGSMFAVSAAVSGTVRGFSWATDDGVKPYRFEKFMEVARAAMARRNVEPGPAYVQRLSGLGTPVLGAEA